MTDRGKKLLRNLNRTPEVLRCAVHSPAWLPLTTRYLGLRQSAFPFKAQFRDHTTFEFQDLADLATWWQIFYREVYPVEANDRVIIDAGANIGAFTLYALKQAPQARIIAIEPFPATFARLKASIEGSPSRARVDLMNVALGSRSGTVAMQDGPMASQFRRVLDDGFSQSKTTVPSCPLQEILAKSESDIDLLKMDIEGSEYTSLLSSPPEALSRIRRIAMELHPLDNPALGKRDAMFEHLAEAGFQVTEVQDHGDGYGMAYLRH